LNTPPGGNVDPPAAFNPTPVTHALSGASVRAPIEAMDAIRSNLVGVGVAVFKTYGFALMPETATTWP
jgi:hypothetical protein